MTADARTILRGAQVISLAPGRPDAEFADVAVEGDLITAIGSAVDDAGADVVDCTNRIVMPGLINAHLHTWQTGLRGVGAGWTLSEYLGNTHMTIAPRYRPSDVYIGELAGMLGQLNCGTTTVGDWFHNALTPEHSDAAVEALVDSGVRAVFFHGMPYSAQPRHPFAEVDRLLGGTAMTNPLLEIGVAIRGPQLSAADVALADMRGARERGVVASMHQSGGAPSPSWDAVRDAGLLGALTNVAHGAGLTDDWISALVDLGVTFTVTTENELAQGHGVPITSRLLAAGSAPSLGTDTDCVVAGDLLSSARLALAYQRGVDHERHRGIDGVFAPSNAVTGKDALSWATVEGARALGISDRVGYLAPGMAADLICIDTQGWNLWPAHDPIAAALASSFGDIDAVMVGGQWRKRHNRLIGVDRETVWQQLKESGQRLTGIACDGEV